jgi:hypothetical protein
MPNPATISITPRMISQMPATSAKVTIESNGHASTGEARDGVGYPVLEVAGAFLCVLDQCRVDGVRQLGWDDGPLQRM